MSATFPKEQSEDLYKEKLSTEAYRVLRQNGTEYPFTGLYDKHFEKGSYHCAACDTQLFESGHKYNSGCGWPAFDTAIPGALLYIEDHRINAITLAGSVHRAVFKNMSQM